jgi:hypothetical protein
MGYFCFLTLNKSRKMILETVVRDGRTKEYRILNLTTGTVYSSSFESRQLAEDAVEHGTKRNNELVKYVSINLILETVLNLFSLYPTKH